MNEKRKKVLIITYYWPPCGGIGVLRCLKIVKYLRDYGWEPIVFTAENPHYPTIDHTNERDIPAGITVLKQKIWEPYSLYKFFNRLKKDANINNIFAVREEKVSLMHKVSVWIRSNFFIPDARAYWIEPSVKFLSAYLEEHPVDAIFSNGPPHSNTAIATKLKNKFSIPWLADFQDPWTQVDYFKDLRLTNRGRKKHSRMEQEAFAAADQITIVSKSWKKDLESIGARNVSVLPWGYDTDDFKDIKSKIDEKFTLSHLGILGEDRHPELLFKVIKELINELPGFKDDFKLNLYGQVGFSVVESVKKIGIESVVELKGNIARAKSLERTASSNLLLLLLNQQANVKGRIPGKLFEYMAASRPIIVLGPTNSDVANIVRDSERGVSVAYNDEATLKTTLLQYYKLYQENKLAQPLEKDISEYSSVMLTKRVAEILDEITG